MKSRRRRVAATVGAALLLCAAVLVAMGAGSALLTSCTTTPTAVPVRTFERAQKVDVVCMQVLNPADGTLIKPTPQPQSRCAPVPAGVDGTYLPYHLFALVTQLGRGEVAVVDLTQGTVVDIDQATPGFNFHVVGKNPTDIAVTPDGLLTFVAAAEINKPAIYALRNDEVLGDWQGAPGSSRPKITNWPACALPQVPSALAIVPTQILATTTATDGGTSGSTDAAATDGDTEGGASDAGDGGTSGTTAAPDSLGYEVVVVLPGDARTSAKIITIDPRPFLRGAALLADAGPQVAPGSLAKCPITSAIELAGGAFAPSQVQPGPAWDDGIKYVDGGAPAEEVPSTGAAICAAGAGFTPDSGLPIDAPPDLAARGGTAALSGQIYYVADAVLPLIHVIDLRSGTMKELPPLLATSITDPSRRVTVSQIAVSPPTREFKRYLYAIDAREGTLIVYDVTDPDLSSRSPLTRPHPEVNPFQAPDRISFSSPVATLAFARNEWPLTFDVNATGAALTGLLCNPNPKADPKSLGTLSGDAGAVRDLGVFYRSNSAITIGPPGISGIAGPSPYRLRGIFGFATLTTGAMVAIDVDDWDAPCRRPDPIIADGGPSSITPGQPDPTSADDLNPYHAPTAAEAEATASTAFTSPVTLEGFFPISAPHRSRSLQYLRNDPALGNHLPRLDVLPQLWVLGSVQGIGKDATRIPILMPTGKNGLVDPNEFTTAGDPNPARAHTQSPIPNIRFAFESPEVHLDQDWTVTFEGIGPNVKGLAGAISTTDDYASITITTDQGLFCRRGVEDFRIGRAKAAAIISAAAKLKVSVPDRLDHKIADYVQLKEDILPVDDPYWGLPQACWDIPAPTASDANAKVDLATPQKRYDACAVTFGSGEDVNPDMTVQRDFPVLEAYQDHLVIGRYGYSKPQAASTSSREVLDRNAGNKSFLKLMQCCFHNQVQFNVRTGGEWVTQGAKNGFLHHVTEGIGGQCVLSCNARDALLNSRAPGVSQVLADGSKKMDDLQSPDATPIGRNQPLAMRNPMFSFYIVNGFVQSPDAVPPQAQFVDFQPPRDSQWRFTTRGQFQPLFVNLASTTTAVSPQSMKFIDSLGQVAIVDGEAQGLLLVDLNVLSLSHSPYY